MKTMTERDYLPHDEQVVEVTEGHLALLTAASWRYEEGDFGAPAMDTKRPYGSGDVLRDIAEIFEPEINWDPDQDLEDGETWGDLDDPENRERFRRIHFEMVLVMDILSKRRAIEVGTYSKEDGFRAEWKLNDFPEGTN